MTAEYFARECRKALACAHQLEVAGDVEFADACGQVARNKLEQALRLGLREDMVVPIKRD